MMNYWLLSYVPTAAFQLTMCLPSIGWLSKDEKLAGIITVWCLFQAQWHGPMHDLEFDLSAVVMTTVLGPVTHGLNSTNLKLCGGCIQLLLRQATVVVDLTQEVITWILLVAFQFFVYVDFCCQKKSMANFKLYFILTNQNHDRRSYSNTLHFSGTYRDW